MTSISKSRRTIFNFKTPCKTTLDENNKNQDSPELFVFGENDSNLINPATPVQNGNRIINNREHLLANTREKGFQITTVKSDFPILYSKLNKPSRSQIDKDLNSPSATCRIRGLQAVRDGLYDQEDEDSEEEENKLRALLPKPVENLNEVLTGVIAYVEVCNNQIDMSEGTKDMLRKLGAIVRDKFLKDVTHVIFKEGRVSTYKKAIEKNIPILSVLWVEMCRKQMYKVRENFYPSIDLEEYKTLALLNKRSKPMKKLYLSRQNSSKSIPTKDNQCELDDSLESSLDSTPQLLDKDTSELLNKNCTPLTNDKSFDSANNLKNNGDKLAVNLMKRFLASRVLKKNDTESNDVITGNDDVSTRNISEMLSKITVSNKLSVVESSKPDHADCKNSKETTSDSFLSEEVVYGTISPLRKKRKTFFTPPLQICRSKSSFLSTDSNLTECESNGSLKLHLSLSDHSKSTYVTDESIIKTSMLSKSANNDALSAKTILSTWKNVNDSVSDDVVIASESSQINSSKSEQSGKNIYIISESLEENSNNIIVEPKNNENLKKSNKALIPNNSDVSYDKDNGVNIMKYNTPKTLINKRRSMRVALRDSLSSSMIKQKFGNYSVTEIRQDESEENFEVMLTPRMQRLKDIETDQDSNNTTKNIEDSETSLYLAEINTNNSKQNNSLLNESTPKISKKRKLYTMNDTMYDVSAVNSSISSENQSNGTRDFYFNLVNNNNKSKSLQKKTNDKRKSCQMPKANLKQNRRITTYFFAESNSVSSQTISDSMLNKMSPLVAPRRSTLDFQAKPSKEKLNNKLLKGNSQKNVMDIVCTSLHTEQTEIVKRVINTLGGYVLSKCVTGNTSHVVAFEPRRTLNLLKGIVRGCWILNFDWILKSEEAKRWLDEDYFEWTSFSPSVQKARIERQAFGNSFRMDIFSTSGSVYIGRKCSPPWQELQDLVTFCCGKIVYSYKTANIIVGEIHSGFICVSPNWILDSITNYKVKSINDYIIQ